MRISLPLAVISAFLLVSCTRPVTQDTNSVFDKIIKNREIRCGYVLYPPFMDRNVATGQVTGIMPKIWDEIGKRLELKISWVEEAGWGTMIEGLRTKRYDAVCSTVWANATRSKYTEFSVPLGYERIALYARADDMRFDKRIDGLNDPAIRFSTLDGEMGSMLVKRRFPTAQNISLPQNASVSDMLMNVVNHKADLVIADPLIADQFMQNNPGTLRIVKGGETLQKFPVTVLLPQSDMAMKSMIDQTIGELQRDGTIQKIMNEAGLPDQWQD